MDGYTLLGLKLAMGIIGLVLQINLMGKGNLCTDFRDGSGTKLCARWHYWWCDL